MATTTLQALRQAIKEIKIPTCPAEDEVIEHFIPEGRIEEILDEVAIVSALKDPSFNIPEHKRQSIADVVVRDSPKLFAILVELELQGQLLYFLGRDVLDNQLPIGIGDPRVKDLLLSKAGDFETLQWEYFPFKFHSVTYPRTVVSEVVVPFIHHHEVGRGGFSRVFIVKIHPKQQNLVSQMDKFLARKRISVSSNPSVSEQDDEAELLFLLGSVKHRNIVELLAAYRQHSFINLIFPYYDQDLHKFLISEHRPPGFEEDATILRALHGLSSGLAHLHRFFPQSSSASETLGHPAMQGYHHDIKPRNILVGDQTFILSDFGCANIKFADQDTQTVWKDTTFEYGAPECRDMSTFIPGKVGRALDIWSLGCIFMETATYMVFGSTGIADLRAERRIRQIHGTVRCFHDGSKLSSKVDNYLDQLQERTPMPVQNIMDVIRAMFSTDPSKRPEVKFVESFINILTLETAVRSLAGKTDALLNAQKSKGSNIFKAQAEIEKTRLEALIHVIGLSPEHSTSLTIPSHIDQLTLSISSMLDNIQAVAKRLDSFLPESGESNSSGKILLGLFQNMNDRLSLVLPKNLQQSVEDTFLILTEAGIPALSHDDDRLLGSAGQNTNVLNMLEQLESYPFSHDSRESQNVGRTSAMRRLSILFSEGMLQPSGTMIIWTDVAETPGTLIGPKVYSYNGMKTLVEWQGYTLPKDAKTTNEDSDLMIYSLFERIQALGTRLQHQPKPDAFRVLDCLGTVQDESLKRVGLLYKFPSNGTSPVQLHRIFRHKGRQEKRPNPSEKLRLAKTLIDALLSFHLSGWIHKNLNSYNVVFFLEEQKDVGGLDISRPYIIGFNYSRPNSRNAISFGADSLGPDKEYRHPHYRREGSRFRQYYDYYSLGLVLLEIGTWNPISRIFTKPESLTLSPEELTKEYIKCCEHDLLLLMGEKYANVVRACLEVDQWSNETETTSSLDYLRRVVEEIRLCQF